MYKLRQLTEVGIVAAVYVALVHLFAPISFALFQFRLAEVMKSFVIYRRHLIWAMAIGVGVANLLSPYGGVWELLWMPVMNLVGGYLTWYLGQRINKYMAAGFFSLWISFAVAMMLYMVVEIPLIAGFISVLPSQAILIIGGLPLVQTINRRLMTSGR